MTKRVAAVWLWMAVAVCPAVAVRAQQDAAWTVKPEWVVAHEKFLASDALAGRGSATRDEEIAATYVASEFTAYGLKPSPGMSGYLQSAEVVRTELDGHGALRAGNVEFAEGTDFVLLVSPGLSVIGPLVRVTGADALQTTLVKGAVVVLSESPKKGSQLKVAQELQRRGAAMIVVPADEESRSLQIFLGGRTGVPTRLREEEVSEREFTYVIAEPAAMAKFAEMNNGTMVSLVLHADTKAKPRKTFNAIGYLEGSGQSGETIVISAHLDHLGVGRPVNGDAIYNGANDDASGTTAVLELAHAMAAGRRLRRNVLFVCFGSEESGDLGSTYFAEHSPVPLETMVAGVELEMLGAQDPKFPKGVMVFTGWERSDLGPALKAHGALLAPDPYVEQNSFTRSDNYSLALKGVVAHTASGWGTVPTYHQPNDDLAHLDFQLLTATIQGLLEPLRWLADSNFKPKWVEGKKPGGRD